MIIDYLDIGHVAILELETYTPLVVYSDAPLPFAISPQGFKAIARWRAEKIQRGCCVELRQLAFGYCLNRAEAPRTATLKQRLSIFAVKRLNHNVQDITPGVICQ